MAKFVFQLEAVLRRRLHQEQEKQRLLADAEAEMVRLQMQLNQLDGSVQTSLDDLRNNRLIGKLDMRFLASHRRFMSAVRQEAMGVVQAMDRQQVKVDEAHRELADAAVQRKMMEKLRDKHHERWRANEVRKECHADDEVATQLSYMTGGEEWV